MQFSQISKNRLIFWKIRDIIMLKRKMFRRLITKQKKRYAVPPAYRYFFVSPDSYRSSLSSNLQMKYDITSARTLITTPTIMLRKMLNNFNHLPLIVRTDNIKHYIIFWQIMSRDIFFCAIFTNF